jgi:hypothetical protein
VVTIPNGYDGVLVDYVWQDKDGVRHWVHGERIPAQDPFLVTPGVYTQLYVRPRAHFNADNSYPWECAVPTTAAVEGLQSFAIVPLGTNPGPGEAGIEPNFGAGLLFAAKDAGKTVMMDYRLQLVNGKRLLYLSEEQVIGDSVCSPDPSDNNFCFATVQLGWSNLAPVFTDPAGNPCHAVAVDVEAQDIYYEQVGMTPLDPNAARMGRIQLHVPVDAVGHHFRFYYGTHDQAAIHVYKPPATFFDATTAASYEDPGVAFRTYTTDAAAPGSPYTALYFSMSNLGATISVDYVWDENGVPRLVVGEMHTLGLAPAGNAAVCSLNKPNVQEIRAVRGVSVKIRPWWRSPGGRLMHYDLDTILLPTGVL